MSPSPAVARICCQCIRAMIAATAFVTLQPALAFARELRAADSQSLDHPAVQAILYLDHYIRDRTDNRLSIRVFPSASLGEDEETISQTRSGVIDMTRVNVSALAVAVPQLDIFNAPHLFQSREHLLRMLDGPLGEELLRALEPHGLVGLAFYESGSRIIYNSVRPVRAVGDLARLRLWVNPAPLAYRAIKALGAEPVVFSYNQVLAGLQTRLIEGGESNLAAYVAADHHVIAKFMTMTGHTMQPDVLLISMRSWNGLTSVLQNLMREAARQSVGLMRRRWPEWDIVLRQQASAEGVVISEDFDKSGFEAALADLRESILAKPGMAILGQRIERLR